MWVVTARRCALGLTATVDAGLPLGVLGRVAGVANRSDVTGDVYEGSIDKLELTRIGGSVCVAGRAGRAPFTQDVVGL